MSRCLGCPGVRVDGGAGRMSRRGGVAVTAGLPYPAWSGGEYSPNSDAVITVGELARPASSARTTTVIQNPTEGEDCPDQAEETSGTCPYVPEELWKFTLSVGLS